MIGDLTVCSTGHDRASERAWNDPAQFACASDTFIAMIAASIDPPPAAATFGAEVADEPTLSAIRTVEAADSDGRVRSVPLDHAVEDAAAALDQGSPHLRVERGARVAPSSPQAQISTALPVAAETVADGVEAPARRGPGPIAVGPSAEHAGRIPTSAAEEAPDAAPDDAPDATTRRLDGQQFGHVRPADGGEARPLSPRISEGRETVPRNAPPARAAGSDSVVSPERSKAPASAEVTADSRRRPSEARHIVGRAEPVARRDVSTRRTPAAPTQAQATPAIPAQAVPSGGSSRIDLRAHSVEYESRLAAENVPSSPRSSGDRTDRPDRRGRDRTEPQFRAPATPEAPPDPDRMVRPARRAISAARHPGRATFPAPASANAAPAPAGPSSASPIASPDGRIDVMMTRPPIPTHSPQMPSTSPPTTESAPTPVLRPPADVTTQATMPADDPGVEPVARPEADTRSPRSSHRRSTHADAFARPASDERGSGQSATGISTESGRLAPTAVDFGALHTDTARRVEGEPRTAPVITVRGPARVSMAELTADRPQRLRLEVHPPSLGRCELELVLRDGRVHATVVAERQETVLALRAVEGQVREQLDARGLQVAEFDVRTGAGTTGHHGSDQDASRHDDHDQQTRLLSPPIVPRPAREAAPDEPGRTSLHTTIDLIA